MMQATVPLGGMPLSLVLLADGRFGIARQSDFPSIIETGEGVNADFHSDGFRVYSSDRQEQLQYQRAYTKHEAPLLVEWIKKQKLPNPFVGE